VVTEFLALQYMMTAERRVW